VKIRRHYLRAFLILLLIAATLSLQAMPLSSHHSTDNLTHRCAFCHLAHVAWANPVQAPTVQAPAMAEWHVNIHKCSGCPETLMAFGHSRAPPD
jgi:hypothetical protein